MKNSRVVAQEWPKLDPITNRSICEKCWNGIHKKKDAYDRIVDACDNMDCDCVHRSEAMFVDMERKAVRDSAKAKRLLEKEALEADDNPLRADNPNFQKKYTGRTHA